MSKVKSGPAAALQDVLRDGMTLAVGGFGLSGIPADLIEAVRDSASRTSPWFPTTWAWTARASAC